MHTPTSRLEMFCDGVFAIAITLLILEIKVPVKETINTSHTLLQAITEAWPSWFAFLLSFGSILVTWTNHHSAFKQINKTSALFNYVNGFFLLTIVVLPYPTALLAEYVNTDSARTAIMVYCLALVFHNVAWILLFQTILKPKNLSKNEASRKIILKGRMHSMYGFTAYLSIAVLSNWFPMIAVCLMAILWVIWIIIGIFMSGIDTETI